MAMPVEIQWKHPGPVMTKASESIIGTSVSTTATSYNLVSWYDEDVLLYGGAVELYRSHAEFSNCRIEGNGVISTKPNFSSIARGGAIHASYSTVLLENNLIRHNYAKAARNRAALNSYAAGALGGAVWASNSDLVIDGGSFRGNMATRVDGLHLPEIARGGAIYLEDSTRTLP